MTKFLWLVLGCLLWAVNAQAQAPFYQGKTIRVIVGTPPGNLYDFWTRLIVDHMGRHIPGNPSFIVQNMPGAGHVIAVNYLYTGVKTDGLTIIGSVIPSLYLNQLIGRTEIQFDWSKFSWIGSPARGNSQMYMRADSPYKTIEDVRTAKEPPNAAPPASPVLTPISPNFCTRPSGPSSTSSPAIPVVRTSNSLSNGARSTAVLSPSKPSSAASLFTPGARLILSIICFRAAASATRVCPTRRRFSRLWTNTKHLSPAGG